MGIKKSLFKCISLVVAVSVSVFPLPVFAETNVTLPLISQSSYVPANITGLVFSFPDPFHFDVVIEPGDSNLDAKALTAETEKLVRYFMAAVAVPDQDLWVNLSPAEADRIIPNALGQTEMGQNLLAQDYLLKRITASLMDPNHEIGKRFWDAVYEKTQTALGTTNIPVDLLNKVWIVPSKAVVVSQGRAVFVTETHFQVMLEEDYFLSSQNPKTAASQDRMGVDVKNIIRQIIIPEIEKEVNSGKNFADLRQIYNAVILATWFKKHLRNSWLGKAYAERSGVDGIQSSDPHAVETIYQNYLEAFRSGVAESIKEDYDPVLQQTVARSYFSGGAALASEEILEERAPDANPDEPLLSDAAMMATVALNGDEENRFFLAGITEAVDKFGLDERLKAEAKVIEEGVRDGVNGYLQGELKEGKFAAFPQAILDTTITSVMTWLQDEAIDVYTKLGILEAIAQNRWEDITSVHSAKVAFGTAGPRAMAIRSLEEAYRLQKDGFKAIILKGPNSINNVTISLLTTGVARAYKEQNKNDVVITYDTRIAGRYFADLVAAVFIKEGLKVYLFDEAAPMPEMAFAVAHFHKSLGILISASHNPFEYNGYKVSNEVGMQLTPDERRRIEKKVYGDKEQTGISLTDVAWILQASTETPTPSELEASPVDGRLGPLVERFAENSGNLVIMGGEDIQADANGRQHVNVHEAHKQHILNNLLMDSDLAKNGIRKLKVIYSAMYGVGESTFRRITSVLGLTPAVVKEYSRPDGIFSRFSLREVDGKRNGILADPGNSAGHAFSWELVVEDLFKQVQEETGEEDPLRVQEIVLAGLDLILGTDPDADRLGVAFTVPEKDIPPGLESIEPLSTKNIPEDQQARVAQLIFHIVPKELRTEVGFGALRLLSANDTWGLILKYRIDRMEEMIKAGRVPSGLKFTIIKTHVTSDLLSALAVYAKNKYGMDTEIIEPYVGFSLVGQRIREGWKQGKINLGGAEESGGFSIGGAAPVFYAILRHFHVHKGFMNVAGSKVSVSEENPLFSLDPDQYFSYTDEETKQTLEYLWEQGLLKREGDTDSMRYSLVDDYVGLSEENYWTKFEILSENSPGPRLGKRGHTLEKDGLMAAILTLEVTARAKQEGKSLYQFLLDELYLNPDIGYYAVTNQSLAFEDNVAGKSQKIKVIKNILQMARDIKDGKDVFFAGQKVERVGIFIPPVPADQKYADPKNFPVEKYQDLIPLLSEKALRDNPELIRSFFPEEGVRFHFSDGRHLTIRPSGTEPKLRFYVQWKTAGLKVKNIIRGILKADILIYRIAMDSQAQVTVDNAQFAGVNDDAFGGIDLTSQAIEERGQMEDDFWAADWAVSDGSVPVIKPVILQMVPARERLLL